MTHIPYFYYTIPTYPYGKKYHQRTPIDLHFK